MSAPLVIKFGGDALASPDRIAAAGRRVEQRLAGGPVVAVASARRGVTDHLLGLVERVKEDTASEGVDSRALRAAANRAVAAGELVAASLLAVALNRLGIPAEVLDAREAGLLSDGQRTRAQITRIRPARLTSLLERRVTPVVTGFQGWYRGQVTTLGRGGSDTTAVALAAALRARHCELVKHAGGLLTADPRALPEALLIPRASHRFLAALAAAGAKVVSLRAALLAEREAVPLRFVSMERDTVLSEVNQEPAFEASAIALRTGQYRFTAHTPTPVAAGPRDAFLNGVTALGIAAELQVVADGTGFRVDILVNPEDLEPCLAAARRLLPRGRRLALLATGLTSVTVVGAHSTRRSPLHRAAHLSGAQILGTSAHADRLSFLVPDAAGLQLLRALHATLPVSGSPTAEPSTSPRLESVSNRRKYVGQR